MQSDLVAEIQGKTLRDMPSPLSSTAGGHVARDTTLCFSGQLLYFQMRFGF